MSNGPAHEHIEIPAQQPGGWHPAVGNETTSLLQHIGLNPHTASVVQGEAQDVLSRCIPPATQGGQETGLIVGYVQSGKTMSFTTVAALARDNGYPLVIVIAGTSVPLTEQSRQRLRHDLQFDHRSDRSWRHLHNPRVEQQDHTRIDTALADWRDPHVPMGERCSILVTVMKNHTHLNHLIQVLSRVNLAGVPVLIIDDEADQAGLNNLINEGLESTTYQRLVALKAAIPHHTFLQYTATPQGPLLINLIDVLSPGFAVTLTPGQDYTGGAEFFLGAQPLVRIIPAAEIPSNANQLHEPPETLLAAMRIFFLGVASGIIRTQGHGNRSMMVHPSQRTGGHRQYFDWVTAIRSSWLHLLESTPTTDPDHQALLAEFQIAYDDLRATVPDLEPFDQLAARLRHAIRRTDMHLINAEQGRTPQIDWRGSYSHILVGGQALDRGFTVEGLTVTYMPRGVGARRADTVQQRARFFGYKRPYLGYCRAFLEQQVADAFTRYVHHEDDIRSELQRVNAEDLSLDELRRSFLLPQGLSATRDSIIDVDYVRARMNAGWFYPKAPQESPMRGDANTDVVTEFVNSLEWEDDEGHEARTEYQRHQVARDVSLRQTYEQLLLGLRFSRLTDAQNLLGILVILRNALRRNPNTLCTVYNMSPGTPRSRTLGTDGAIPNLFQGAAPVQPRERRGEVYPGDREIHANDQITIQLHTLNLDPHAESPDQTAFENVPNIAVWLPPGYAGDVLIQDQGGPDEADNG